MDAKDVRIFCELAFKEMGSRAFTERHPSPAGIARKLGLDEKTVRLRVKKMEEAGFIKYYQVTPELALFGLKCLASYRFEAMNIATKYGVVKYVQGLPGVVEAFDYLGPTLSISLAGVSPSRVHQQGDEIAGRFELKTLNLGDVVIGEPHSRPDRLDWKIIENLRYDARSTHKEVADALEISPRMAEYRIRKLMDSGAVLVRAVINPQKQEGLVFYELAVTVERERKTAVVRAVKEKYGEKLWSLRVSATGVLLLNMFGFTLGEPEEAAMELLGIGGVRWCSILILKEILEPTRPNWIDVLIQEEIASAHGQKNDGTRVRRTRT
ncbi:MAG TPA: Lrp/AsnC family transcriptional regulator [Thermoplasmata archaeon]|nr:Lrp/AsnC family transcriptional regulator [Thermoplasmata archaeon]